MLSLRGVLAERVKRLLVDIDGGSNLVDVGSLAPVVVVGGESDTLVALIPVVELEHASADWLRAQGSLQFSDGLRGEHAGGDIVRLYRNGAYCCSNWIVIS